MKPRRDAARTDKRTDLTARNFPSAQHDAQVKPPPLIWLTDVVPDTQPPPTKASTSSLPPEVVSPEAVTVVLAVG